jgi:hypothetical protein
MSVLELEVERLHVTSKKQRQLLKDLRGQECEFRAKTTAERVAIEKHEETIHKLQVEGRRKDASLGALEEELRLHRVALAELKDRLQGLQESSECRASKKENELKIKGELSLLKAQLEREKKVEVDYIDELVSNFRPLRC